MPSPRILIALATLLVMASLAGAAFGAVQDVQPTPKMLSTFGSTTAPAMISQRIKPLYVERTIRTSHKLHRVPCPLDPESVCYAAG
jgi:hypothetical protein